MSTRYYATMLGLLALCIIILIFCSPARAYGSRQMIQSCGQGVVIFGDGSITIDAWKTFSPIIINPTLPIPTSVKESTIDYPSKVEYKKGVKGSLPVCFEDELGTHCVTLAQLRKVR